VAVTGGAPPISEVVRYWPALIPQEAAQASVSTFAQGKEDVEPSLVAQAKDLSWPETGGSTDAGHEPQDPYPASLIEKYEGAAKIEVSLVRVAHARSGDKGDTASIGLIGRSVECYVWLRENVTAERVKRWFESFSHGEVERHLVPNLWALNFLLHESLGGGGTVSLHIDAQGKTYGPAVLRCKVEIPEPLLETISEENEAILKDGSQGVIS
jgi:hypothetical protein